MSRLRSLALALSLAAACPLAAQQLVGHVPLLPARAGFNPYDFAVDATVDPTTSDVFVLGLRGLSALDRAADTFANVFLGDPAGSLPVAMVFDPLSRRLYVSDIGSNELLAVDGATRAVLARLAIPFPPGRLAYNTVNRVIYVLDSAGPQIAAVDAGSLTVLGMTVMAGDVDRAVVSTASNRVYVSSSGAGELYVLEADLTLRNTIPLPGALDLAVNPTAGTGGKVYAVAATGIAVVDAATETVTTTVAASNPTAVVADTASGFAYALYNLPGPAMAAQIVVIDASDGRTTVDVGGTPTATLPTGLALDAAGGRLFVGDVVALTQARVTVFNVSGGAPVRVNAGFTGFAQAGLLVFHPGTAKAYAADPTTFTVAEIDPATAVATGIALGAALEGGALNETTGIALALDTSTNQAVAINVANPAGAPVRTTVGSYPFLARAADGIGPNGEFYVINQNTRSISILDAATAALLRTKTGVPNDVTFGFDIDRNFAGGATPKGFLTNPRLDFTPNANFVQSYKPAAADVLTGIAGNCFTGTCVVGAPVACDEPNNRMYTWGAVVRLGTPTVAVAAFNSQTEAFSRQLDYNNPSDPTVTGYFPPTLLADGNRHAFFPEIEGGTRVVRVTDTAPPPLGDDIATVDFASALAFAGSSLYMAEPDASLVEVADTSLTPPAVTTSYATGGSPGALLKQPGNDVLFVGDDGSFNVQAWDTLAGTQDMDFGDLAFLGFNTDAAFVGTDAGRAVFTNNRHGSLVVLDPARSPVVDLQIDQATLPDGVPAGAYAGFTLTATGARGPLTWEVTSGGTGAAPFQPAPGLTLDPSTGAIAGLPTQPGAFSFMVRVSDGGVPGDPPRYDLQEFQVQVLDLTLVTFALPPASGCGGGPYNVALRAAGGEPPYTWSSTLLPSWVSLDPVTGVLSGTPPGTPENCPIGPNTMVQVMDSGGATRSMSFCLTVTSGGAAPSPVGNLLRAVHNATEVVMTVLTTPPAGGGFNVYRSAVKGSLGTVLGTPPTTTTSFHRDPVLTDGMRYFYQWRAVSACGTESP